MTSDSRFGEPPKDYDALADNYHRSLGVLEIDFNELADFAEGMLSNTKISNLMRKSAEYFSNDQIEESLACERDINDFIHQRLQENDLSPRLKSPYKEALRITRAIQEQKITDARSKYAKDFFRSFFMEYYNGVQVYKILY